MTEAATGTALPPDPLAQYVSRMRRHRRIYFAILVVAVIVVVVVVQVVLRSGEIGNATLHQAKSAVAGPPSTATTSTTLTQAWHSDDKTASGVPFDTGTVITYDTHTVTGRNYATGDAVWSYTRSDASICAVFQQTGITVAIFTDPDGFCDEIDGFKTGTGARDWYRTLDTNGNTLYTRPVITESPFTVMISAPNYIQAVDPVSAIDRWTFTEPKNCTTTSSVMGTGGVLISQHCGNGDHLILRDAYAGNEDNNASAGVKWNILSDAVPLTADSVITALDPASGKLLVYSAADGKVSSTQTLTPAPVMSPAPALGVVSGNNSELATIGDSTYALDMSTGRQLWSGPLIGPATLATANPLAITAAGIVELDPQTGKVAATYPITAPPAGSSAVRLGTGFVVAGSSTTVYR